MGYVLSNRTANRKNKNVSVGVTAGQLCCTSAPIQPTHICLLSRQLTKHRPTPPTAPGLQTPLQHLVSGHKTLPLLQLEVSRAASTNPQAPQFIHTHTPEKLTAIVKSARGSLTANFILFTLSFTFTFNEIIATALRQGEEDAQKVKWNHIFVGTCVAFTTTVSECLFLLMNNFNTS